MKANHNDGMCIYLKKITVTNINISKNESKSQLFEKVQKKRSDCNKYQYFKE